MNPTPEQIEAHYQKQLQLFNDAMRTQLLGKQDEIDRLIVKLNLVRQERDQLKQKLGLQP